MRIGQHLINSREVSQRRLSLLNALNSANLFPKANADNQSINQKMCIVAYHCNSFTAYFFHRPITCKASLEYNRVGCVCRRGNSRSCGWVSTNFWKSRVWCLDIPALRRRFSLLYSVYNHSYSLTELPYLAL